MSVFSSIPHLVFCQKCDWYQVLDLQTHGPWFQDIETAYLMMGVHVVAGWELANLPKRCPACGNTRLQQERGLCRRVPENPGEAKELCNFLSRFRKSML